MGIIASFVVLLSFIFPSHAQTTLGKGQQQIQYDVYAGGIHTLQANLNISVRDGARYDVDLTAKTYGLLGKLAPWSGKFESHGWHDKTFKPELHQATTTWRDSDEIKKYNYNKDGSFNSYSVEKNKKDKSPKQVDSKLTENTSDMLTATLNTMQQIAATGKCEGVSEVFDGKRRFKLIFKEIGQVTLEASRLNVYSGPAVECSVEVEPIVGKWHEKPRGWMSIQEQGRAQGALPTVWFAKVKEGELAVPVKVRVKTSYGTLFMQMTKYQALDKTLPVKKK